MIIGITGGTGCGKTTLLEEIRQKGGLVLDCDAIYHELLDRDRSLLSQIESRFPGTVEHGKLMRKKLGNQVFSDPAALNALNQITHTAVVQEIKRRIMTGPELIGIDGIALVESGLSAICDVTVAVTAPREERVLRLMARDGISREYAEKRIDAQKQESFYRENCDYVLTNDGSREEFREISGKWLESL